MKVLLPIRTFTRHLVLLEILAQQAPQAQQAPRATRVQWDLWVQEVH